MTDETHRPTCRITRSDPKSARVAALRRFVAACLVGLSATGACADDYPTRAVRMIVPQSPGSATDVLVRLIGPRMGQHLGQPIVVDNRAGAGGIVGADIAAKSAPDGYTLLVGATSWITVAPHTHKALSYQPLVDFEPVALFCVGQNLLVVPSSSPIRSVTDLINQMKRQPGRLNMASAGLASSSHLAGLLFTSLAGVDATHVPYKGAGQSVVAVISAEADWTFTPMQGPLSHVRAGKLRALAVGGVDRSPSLPDVPTVSESGLPGYFSGTWYGVLLPRGAPAAVADRIRAALAAVIAGPDMREQLLAQGAEPKFVDSAEFARFIRDEHERIGRVVNLAGLKAE
jgi:tripartite-type tricarboxylate transporter receptor subunit TctC